MQAESAFRMARLLLLLGKHEGGKAAEAERGNGLAGLATKGDPSANPNPNPNPIPNPNPNPNPSPNQVAVAPSPASSKRRRDGEGGGRPTRSSPN